VSEHRHPAEPRELDPEREARRALVFHDRPLVVDLISLTLNHGMFLVRAVPDIAEAERVIALWRPHMAVVDMERDDASDVLRKLGASGALESSKVPILGLTSRSDLATKLRAFELGVDDILSTPFSPQELLARSIVIVRRASGVEWPIMPTIRSGDIEIDVLARQIRIGQRVVALSGIEQSLLYVLAGSGGRVVSRDEILDAVWGTDFMSESNVVDSHIRALRNKLGDDYRRPRFIATVPGRGYRFVLTFSDAGWQRHNGSQA
jgi:DNA-binding response OmpR family regulator